MFKNTLAVFEGGRGGIAIARKKKIIIMEPLLPSAGFGLSLLHSVVLFQQ